MKNVYVIRGGIWGPDGIAFSRGMDQLAQRIRAAGRGTNVGVYNWSNWNSVVIAIRAEAALTTTVLVGYSGGCMVIPSICEYVRPKQIELVIGYDPSPPGKVYPLPPNVRHVVCYHNNAPNFLGYGGEHFRAKDPSRTKIDEINVAENHVVVQFDEQLHKRTLNEIKNV